MQENVRRQQLQFRKKPIRQTRRDWTVLLYVVFIKQFVSDAQLDVNMYF